MFVIEKPEYINKTFRIDRELLYRLEIVAQNENISINALVSQCCQYALNNMDKSKTYCEKKSNR